MECGQCDDAEDTVRDGVGQGHDDDSLPDPGFNVADLSFGQLLELWHRARDESARCADILHDTIGRQYRHETEPEWCGRRHHAEADCDTASRAEVIVRTALTGFCRDAFRLAAEIDAEWFGEMLSGYATRQLRSLIEESKRAEIRLQKLLTKETLRYG